MQVNQVITGHEVEMAEIEAQQNSHEFRAACIKGAEAKISEASATLVSAANGTLKPYESIFGVSTPEAQVEQAKHQIEVAISILARYI